MPFLLSVRVRDRFVWRLMNRFASLPTLWEADGPFRALLVETCSAHWHARRRLSGRLHVGSVSSCRVRA